MPDIWDWINSGRPPQFPQGQPPPIQPMAQPPVFAQAPQMAQDIAANVADPLLKAGNYLGGLMQGSQQFNWPDVIQHGAALAMAMAPGPKGERVAGAVERGLAMDEASRMARAAKQGYTIDAYKGLYPYDWNTVPETTGMGKVVPGTENRVPQELTSINSPNAPYAGFFSSDPQVANRFAQGLGEGSVLPAKLKFERPLVIDAKGQHAANFQFESVARQSGTMDQYNAFKNAFEGDKYDGVILKNTKDEGTVYIPRNPNQVRSRFAAFDPANIKSEHLLASLIGALGGSMAAPFFPQQQQQQ